MKEISYEGSPFKKEESEWLKNHRRTSAPPPPIPVQETAQRAPIADVVKSAPVTGIPVHEEEEDHHLGIIIFMLMLVLAFGVGIGAYVLIGTDTKPDPIPEVTAVADVAAINSVQDTEIVLSGSPRTQILVDIALAFKNTSLEPNGVHRISFLMNEAGGKTRQATVRELFEAIRMERVPETLFTSLEDTVTYEIRGGEELAGKLTLNSRSNSHTFGAFFDWEERLAPTLIPLLHPILSTSYLKDLEERKFHDERINMIDARVLVDIMGDAVLIYGFTDQKTLVIAGSREAFLSGTQTQEE